jgi:hypothetical protein
MAIASNNSEMAVAASSQLYSGIFSFQVVAVNPNLAELKDLGINAQKEPEYKISIQNETYNKIVFWVKSDSPAFTTKFEVLVQPNTRANKDGNKFLHINNIGQITWSSDIPTYDWWKNPDQTRKAFVGEDTLINFTKAWANVATGGEVSFDTIEAIVNGDVAELKEYVKVLGDNRLRLLVGVKDEKYQVIYNKHFGRMKPVRDDLFIKSLNDDYGSFNADYNTDLKPQVYSPTLVAADDDTDPSLATDAGPGKDLWEQQ